MSFRIVPVMDIKDGKAVHAVRGARDAYEPVSCQWCENGDPVALAEGYRNVVGLDDLYIADLDAITRGEPNWGVLDEVKLSVQGRVMIDAGIRSREDHDALVEAGFDEIILGTETMHDASLLDDILGHGLSTAGTIISIDFKAGVPLSPMPLLQGLGPVGSMQAIDRWGPSGFIYLDLARVGSGDGYLQEKMAMLPKATSLPVYLGGGIKTVADIKAAMDDGYAGVLVATAILNGNITREDLARLTLGI